MQYYKDRNKRYLKVMFGNKSSANGFEYKINEVNIADNWEPSQKSPKDIGGFNISTEDKILRWLVRGDTIYDVTFPEDTEIIECESESAPHGVFLANKIILKNPRIVTDEMAMKLYKKSDLPEKSYFKAMAGCCVRGHINTARQIFKDKINKNNIDLAISEFEDFCKPTDGWKSMEKDFSQWNGEYIKEIYEMLKKFKNMQNILNSLSKSNFRSKFHLKQKDKDYIKEKGMDKIREHAYDFINKRLAPENIQNDGKQTPMRGHPVFIAQHATATCCRGCLYKWHKIPSGIELNEKQKDYIVDVIMAWIDKEK